MGKWAAPKPFLFSIYHSSFLILSRAKSPQNLKNNAIEQIGYFQLIYLVYSENGRGLGLVQIPGRLPNFGQLSIRLIAAKDTVWT